MFGCFGQIEEAQILTHVALVLYSVTKLKAEQEKLGQAHDGNGFDDVDPN